MLSLINLIRNEEMKIYRRVSNMVMVGILLALIIGMGIFLKLNESDAQVPWENQLKANNERLEESLQNNSFPEAVKESYKKDIKINNYRLEHNIPPIKQNSLWGFMNDTTNFVQVITIFTVVVGAGVVAGEFSWGTIKLLLIRPVSRSKILLSKYLTTLLYAVFMLALLFVVSLLTGGLLFGFEGFNQPYLAYVDGEVVETGMATHILKTYAYDSVQLIMMVTFAFMMSVIFRSSSLAIGLTMFLMFTGSNFVFLFASMGYDWVKYIFFANTDLTQYIDGIPIVEGMTLSFSITVLVSYFIAFNLLSWFIFKKRDVAA